MRRTRGTPPVHPRSRGEHEGNSYLFDVESGSSPLARGTPPEVGEHRADDRFIPARAGNTCTFSGAPPRAAVHPRSRGEHALTRMADLLLHGSSPLARGTHRPFHHLQGEIRFIPARAGNTCPGRRRGRGLSVHPRSRGEHDNCTFRHQDTLGSSPLARGTPMRRYLVMDGRRFIPARAGNTLILGLCSDAHSVHPRSRGEHPPTRVAA